jgi:hypothetical protein
MFVLRIEHPVPDFDGWKEAFDRDPVNRERSGVRRHRILRPSDDARYVLVDLEFDEEAEAVAMLASLRGLWNRVDGKVMSQPRARIVEVVASREYAGGWRPATDEHALH